MKRNTIKAAAPIARRASFQNPLAFPGIRFVGDGGDGSAVGDGGAPAGDGQEAQGGDESTPPSNDAETPANDGQRAAQDDEQTGSQADDPKLKAARDEAAQNRIKAREATEQMESLRTTLGKALGLIKDDDGKGEGPDAEALAKQIADEQAKATSAARELAVYKAAASNGADPAKLLDSRSFLSSIENVDHADDKAIGQAIKSAVDGNRSFALARVAGASTADTASGPGGRSTPKAEVSLDDAVASHFNS
ncbi:hypothetical protein [Brevibacterium oceani]|uniref:hypothetical protein n=1 Tax=Brevibacterium oceani TaxID=358099 RepID=UPI0015E7D442|nr:hypothetical protein [Brevibacterium oceani]